jgi:large subunit ribosomal protein L2
VIDCKRNKRGVAGQVEYIEYDPSRTAFITRLLYQDGERRCMLAPDGLKKADEVLAADSVDVKAGNAMPLRNIPLGTAVHHIERKLG